MMAPRLLVHLSEADLRDLVRAEVETLIDRGADGPRLLDRAGASRYLGVSVRQLDRLVAEGAPRLMIGDSPRFEAAELLRWLRTRAEQAKVRDRGGLRVLGASVGEGKR